jgi:hypothetical protein
MTDTTRSPARRHFEADGYFIQGEPIFPPDRIGCATEGMDAVRSGEYDKVRGRCCVVMGPCGIVSHYNDVQ